jgi:hypothetical protein
MKKSIFLFLLLIFIGFGCEEEKQQESDNKQQQNDDDESNFEKCVVEGKVYNIGESFTVWCNICTCTEKGAVCDETDCSTCEKGEKKLFDCNDKEEKSIDWCDCINPENGWNCINDPKALCDENGVLIEYEELFVESSGSMKKDVSYKQFSDWESLIKEFPEIPNKISENKIDFENDALFVISMGWLPTTGCHKIELNKVALYENELKFFFDLIYPKDSCSCDEAESSPALLVMVEKSFLKIDTTPAFFPEVKEICL